MDTNEQLGAAIGTLRLDISDLLTKFTTAHKASEGWKKQIADVATTTEKTAESYKKQAAAINASVATIQKMISVQALEAQQAAKTAKMSEEAEKAKQNAIKATEQAIQAKMRTQRMEEQAAERAIKKREGAVGTSEAGFSLSTALNAYQAFQPVLAATVNLLRDSKNAYRDFVEQASKSEQVFKEASNSIKTFAEDSVNSLNMSKRATYQATSDFGNLFNQLELGRQKSAEMSKAMVSLAADLSSFHNISLDDAFEKIKSGLVGESEPLRSLGVNIQEVTLKHRAFEMGLIRTEKEVLPPQIKMLAAYEEILRQTKDAQGDLARTADSAANQERKLQAETENLKQSFGEKLMPAWKEFLTVGNAIVTMLGSMAQNIDNIKPSPGLEMVVKNLKDGAEAAKRFADAKSFNNSDQGKVAGYNSDRSYFGQFVDDNGNVSYPQNSSGVMELSQKLRDYGLPANIIAMGSADYKAAILEAIRRAKANYDAAWSAYRSQFTKPLSDKTRAMMNGPAGGDDPWSATGSVPQWQLDEIIKENEAAAKAAEKSAKQRAAALARAERAKLQLFNQAGVLGIANENQRDDADMAASAGRYGQDYNRFFKPLKTAFPALGHGLVGTMRGAKVDAENYSDLSKVSDAELLDRLGRGELSGNAAIAAIDNRIASTKNIANAWDRYQEAKRWTDVKTALTDDERRRTQDTNAFLGEKAQTEENNRVAYDRSRGNMSDAAYREWLQRQQHGNDQYSPEWMQYQEQIDELDDRRNPGKTLAASMQQAFSQIRVSLTSFQSFYKSIMGGIVQATQEAAAKIIAIWATTQLGKSLGAFGGPVGELFGAIGGSLLGNLFGGRSMQTPGYNPGGRSQGIIINFPGTVYMNSPQDINALTSAIALHTNRQARVMAN